MLRRLRPFGVVALALIIAVSQSTPTFARDAMFRAQNDVLYYDDSCGAAQGATAARTVGAVSNVDCGVDADGDQGNKDKIWGFLVSQFTAQGYSKEEAEMAAAGVMGNMYQETGGTFNPNIDHGNGCNNGPAIGLNQWCFDRQTNLKSFGDEKGTGWGCLGTQLNFLWNEMDTTHSHLYEAMKGKSPSEAAEIFDHGGDGASTGVRGFEESWDSQQGMHKRAGYAEQIYKEYTGKNPSEIQNLGSSSNNRSNSTTSCATAAGSTSGGPVPSEECAALLEEYKALAAAGKITYYGDGNRDFVNKDLENCTTDQIECGTGGKGGVHPRILRATVAAAKNSGASNLEQWNFNSGHGCDGLNHPRGMAIDIYCEGNSSPGANDASEDCNKLFKYFADNYEELGLTELIWQYPPSGYPCGGKILCNVAGHTDHIHAGTRVQ